jgi:tetratricopeptide (TPR) repeat protein
VADVLLGQNRADEAIALYREALALTERILVAFGPSSKRLSDVCASKFQLAEVLSDQDMHDEAIELFREAEALRDRILAGTWLAAPEYTVQGD